MKNEVHFFDEEIPLMDMMDKKKLTIESALDRLEEISQILSSGEASVNDAVKLYKEAAEMLTACKSRIKDARAELEKIDVIMAEEDND